MKRFIEYSMHYDQEDTYVNNDLDTQLQFKYLHKFTPKKLYYYYEFYGITKDKIDDDDTDDWDVNNDCFDLNENKIIFFFLLILLLCVIARKYRN